MMSLLFPIAGFVFSHKDRLTARHFDIDQTMDELMRR
jgi:hypothetical protein